MSTLSTSQKHFSFETQGHGAVALAAKRIAAGEQIAFECYNRTPLDSTMMDLKAIYHISLYRIPEDGTICLRISESTDMDAVGSHSLLASWYKLEIVKDPVHIAAAIMSYFKPYSDYFIV